MITNELLTLSEIVLDPATAILTFDKMRWFRSISGATGPFEEITALAATTASIKGDFLQPHALHGKTLKFKVNGATEVDVTFAGSDPYSTASAITDITGATGLVVATDDGTSRLVLTTVATGTGASIEILESDGALALGFQTGQFAIGKDADTTLSGTQHQYLYTDHNGSKDYWYRTQLRNSTSFVVAPISPPFPGSEVPAIDYTLTIAAFVRIIDLRGRPIEGRSIVISNVFLPNTVGNFNMFRHYEDFATDETGYGEIRLIRGSTIDVHVEGTDYTRRIKLPLVGDPVDLVNLFDPTLTSEDEFGIQEPDINFAIRLS